ncbi:MAG TPA: LysE family translocator [Paucimonas sp.]|nr:LysE family translocator [Paucimonas sp.]
MIPMATYAAFLLAVLALFLSPGPNMAFVLSHGIAHGPRGGFAAALGIGAADLIMTMLTAAGVTAAVAAWPPAFDILRYAGAIYLIRLAILALRSPGQLRVSGQDGTSMFGIFRRAMLNSLLNPKALLFFMVFLPQFVDASRSVWPQILALGATLSVAAVAFNALLGGFSGRIGSLLERNPRAVRVQGWFLAAVMLSLACRLLWFERPAAH